MILMYSMFGLLSRCRVEEREELLSSLPRAVQHSISFGATVHGDDESDAIRTKCARNSRRLFAPCWPSQRRNSVAISFLILSRMSGFVDVIVVEDVVELQFTSLFLEFEILRLLFPSLSSFLALLWFFLDFDIFFFLRLRDVDDDVLSVGGESSTLTMLS